MSNMSTNIIAFSCLVRVFLNAENDEKELSLIESLSS